MEKGAMPNEARPLNPRRAPKSRNGCLRCKAKRLKCDEGKPECHQCTRKQVPCPGYRSKTLVWSTKHEKMLNKSASMSSSPSMVPQNLTTLTLEEELCTAEKRPVPTRGHEDFENSTGASPITSMPKTVVAAPRRDSNQFTDSLSAIRQQLNRSTVPEFLLHLPTMLVEYYFNYVCQIFSSFDGILNPFRSTVGRLWDGSAPIYYAIQSMAAAYLANHFPRMSPVGVQMQRETYKCLYQGQSGAGSEDLDKTLLTVLLVGQTTAWHDHKDLGLVHLRNAKRLNGRRLGQQLGNIDGRAKRQNEFFEQCILYWDMLAGFVNDDVDDLGFGQYEVPVSEAAFQEASTSTNMGEKVFPHPWTGIAPKAQKLFAQVGRLIRNHRKITAQDVASLNFLSLDLGFDVEFPRDFTAAIEATTNAKMLEEKLLSFQPPSISNLVDAGDENTPVQQYLFLAEAYRCAALLEIYRVFPSILLSRLPSTQNDFSSSSNTTSSTHQLFELLSVPPSQAPADFLVSFALHTISLLEKLPSTSGTRCLQPIVVIAAGSELRFSPPQMRFSERLKPYSEANITPTFNGLTSRELDIASARRFVTTRLQEFQLSLPAKPIVKALALVQETWARMDMGQDVFWMDVMEECGWNTIFG